MFRTEINPIISDQKINLKTPIIAMGSCFSDNIGGRLMKNKFDIVSNPFGVVFNPISINKLLKSYSQSMKMIKKFNKGGMRSLKNMLPF